MGAVDQVQRRRCRLYWPVDATRRAWPACIILVAPAASGRERINLYKPDRGSGSYRRLALFTADTLCVYVDHNCFSWRWAYSLDALIPGLMNKHVARRRVSTGYQLPMPQRVD